MREDRRLPAQYFNATQARYPPGSTFKLVTTTAALDSGKYTPDSMINGHGPIMVSGHSARRTTAATSYGQVTLTKALTDSINMVYAQLGVTLGGSLMQKYMERFGFYSVPPLDYPAGQMRAQRRAILPGQLQNNKLVRRARHRPLCRPRAARRSVRRASR